MKTKIYKAKSFLIFISFALCGIMLMMSGCTASSRDLYNYGLNVTTLMEKMIKDPTFTKTILSGELDFSNFLANDYDTPINAYTISIPTSENILKRLSEINNDDIYEKYQTLSIDLKKQIDNKVNFNTMIEVINVQAKTNKNDDLYIALYYFAQISFEGTIKENIAYLYTFETGKPIIVTFENYNNKILATGHFFIENNFSTLSDTREVFQGYGCSVNVLKI